MGTSGDLNDWGCLEIQGTVVTNCRNEDIPADGHVKIPEGVTETAATGREQIHTQGGHYAKL